MAKTKIDDLAQGTEELGAAEQKTAKGGALQVAGSAATIAAAQGGAVLAAGASSILLATQRRKGAAAPIAPAPGDGDSSSVQANPLYKSASLPKKPLP